MPGQLKVTKTRGKVSKGTHDTPEKSTLRTQRGKITYYVKTTVINAVV